MMGPYSVIAWAILMAHKLEFVSARLMAEVAENYSGLQTG